LNVLDFKDFLRVRLVVTTTRRTTRLDRQSHSLGYPVVAIAKLPLNARVAFATVFIAKIECGRWRAIVNFPYSVQFGRPGRPSRVWFRTASPFQLRHKSGEFSWRASGSCSYTKSAGAATADCGVVTPQSLAVPQHHTREKRQQREQIAKPEKDDVPERHKCDADRIKFCIRGISEPSPRLIKMIL